MTKKESLLQNRELRLSKKKEKRLIKKVSLFTFLINLISVVVLFVMIASYKFLPIKYLILYTRSFYDNDIDFRDLSFDS